MKNMISAESIVSSRQQTLIEIKDTKPALSDVGFAEYITLSVSEQFQRALDRP